MSKRSERLAEALLADATRATVRDERIIPCMSCGHTFVYRGRRGDLNGRFCAMRCQEWFDAGNEPMAAAIHSRSRCGLGRSSPALPALKSGRATTRACSAIA